VELHPLSDPKAQTGVASFHHLGQAKSHAIHEKFISPHFASQLVDHREEIRLGFELKHIDRPPRRERNNIRHDQLSS
jgi:hypothetical protein